MRGSGQVNASLVNTGTTRVDADGRNLRLLGAPKTNNNLIEAVDSGSLLLEAPVNRGATGRIVADGGVVTLRDTISGGQIDSRLGLFEVAGGSGRLDSIDRIQGDVEIENGRDLNLRGDTTLDGTIVINREGSTTGTRLLMATDTTFDGAGEIFLNDSATSTTLGRAQFSHLVGGLTTVLGPDISLTGNGNVNGRFVYQGRVAPGKAGAAFGQTGILRHTGTVEMADSTVVEIQLGGRAEGEFDHSDGSAAITVDGTLDASLVDGFTPDTCENFVIISGGSVSGEFDTLIPPVASTNRK